MALTSGPKPTPPETVLLSKVDTQALIEAWNVDPAIVELLPVRFPNGAALNVYTAKCGRCGHDIKSGDFRGRISFPIPTVAVIAAAGVCHECNVITRYAHRLRDSMTLEWIGADGCWKSEVLKGPSRLRQILNRVMRSLSSNQ